MSDSGALPVGDTIKSKGYTLRGGLAYVEENYGADGRVAVVEAVEDPDHRAILAGTVLSGGWYAFGAQVDLYRAIDKVFGSGDLSECRRVGRYTADLEFSTIHRVILKLGNVGHLLRISGAMWGRYYSVGKMKLTSSSDGEAIVEVSSFNPIHTAFCADLEGWMERTMELSGCQGGSLRHTRCLLDGEPSCRYEGKWQP